MSDPVGEISVVVASPVGPLELVAVAGALRTIRFDAPADRVVAEVPDDLAAPLARTARQLAEYFAGTRRVFDLPLAPVGTDFRRRVWDVLATVPWGTTTTYGEIASRLGLPPGASRAVGAANGANPLPVVLPCHRVVGSDGTLTGYAGGLGRKATLLRLEHVATEADQTALF
ncbi:methylated-DNA--[protein]-cysteine S-methyltransferase [Phycicoccus sp. CSK15P-2]|uniref:methylated-DNA--[protein]-cysteine S-methyltransferase n=1 Tax=Phycicoccus sp. CSK15P-2 TaxID=2807627 RepID=UPI00194DC881|nr:methylated-DNA--[protein]-cysteine S-methyltransferase [Phycicoccus sp. CSK15P-2]MBM6405228.1 methylated-DNA--[protein]-cysteine S-methyltransferase [Phycicoccus sp. CSK15P-2]